MFSLFSKNKKPADQRDVTESEWKGGIVSGADALRRRRDVYGQALRFPAGESIQQDNSGGLSIKNRSGNIVKTVDRFDRETVFGWNPEGQMISVALATGESFKKIENGSWVRILDNGKLQVSAYEFSVLRDGTLRIGYGTANGSRFFRDSRLDGSATMLNEKGRLLALKADLASQHERLYKILDNLLRERLINNDQRQGMCDAYHALVRRVCLEEISKTQAAQTVFHINRLLEAGGNSPLGAQLCFMLAHELMFFSALPNEADTSDSLSVLIAQLYRHQPQQAAMLVAEMNIHKRYVTASGLTVKYIDELMHPVSRKRHEWSAPGQQKRFAESNRFLRVILVNIVEKSRIAKRAQKENLALIDEARRAFTTREFGRVFGRELADLFEHVTGTAANGLDFSSRKEIEKWDRANDAFNGHNSSEVA